MVARMLALTHHLQEAIDKGIVADRASVTRSLGFTRARVTQLLDLLMLAPDIQEHVLGLEAVDGVEPIGERALREVAHAGPWEGQRVALSAGLPGRPGSPIIADEPHPSRRRSGIASTCPRK
jgi:hypothetical protein